MSQPTSIDFEQQPEETPIASVASSKPRKKASINVYTMMLILSFLSLVTGCTLLYLEYKRFG